MLEIKDLAPRRLGGKSSLAWLVGGARNVTLAPGATAAMARMKGRCQMTSPMPGFTWITACCMGGQLPAGQRLRLVVLAPNNPQDQCAPTCSISILPEDRIALRPAAPRDAARLLVVRPGATPELEDRIMRDLPALLRPRRRRRRQRHQGLSRQSVRPPARPRRARAGHCGDADQAARRLALPRFGQAGEAPCGRRRGALRQRRPGLLSRSARRHGRGQRAGGRGRRGDAFVLVLPTRCSIRRWPSAATCRCRLISRAAASVDERDRSDYQTMFARQEGSVAAPTAGLHFTEGLTAGFARARRRSAAGDAACRARHVSAGQGRRHRRPQNACRVGQRRRGNCGGA